MRKNYRIGFTAFLLAAAAILPAQAQKLSLPKISGLVNGRYSWSNEDGNDHGFDVRRVRLAATGDITPKLDYKIQAEYETNVKIIDAYVRWKIAKPFAVQIGEFKVPYSLETSYGPTTWQTIENPTPVAKLNGYQDISGLKANGRDVGILFYGDIFPSSDGSFSYLSYKAGVFNGNGINTKDNNNKKDVAAQLLVRPIKHLTLSGAHYQGNYGARHEEKVRVRQSAGFEWKDSQFTLRSEYLHGRTGNEKSNGAYATAAYKIGKYVEPVLSYDYFKQDTKGDEYQNDYQVGINVSPIKHLRIQAAYTFQDYKVAKNVHLVEVQGIIDF